jgi:hypothetical protein
MQYSLCDLISIFVSKVHSERAREYAIFRSFVGAVSTIFVLFLSAIAIGMDV